MPSLNLVCISHLQHMAVQTRHISGVDSHLWLVATVQGSLVLDRGMMAVWKVKSQAAERRNIRISGSYSHRCPCFYCIQNGMLGTRAAKGFAQVADSPHWVL